MLLHFPFVETGPVRPLCGERQSKNAWTTSYGAVTCPRCLALLGAAEAESAPADWPRTSAVRVPVRTGHDA